jgi:hypothetical protein
MLIKNQEDEKMITDKKLLNLLWGLHELEKAVNSNTPEKLKGFNEQSALRILVSLYAQLEVLIEKSCSKYSNEIVYPAQDLQNDLMMIIVSMVKNKK